MTDSGVRVCRLEWSGQGSHFTGGGLEPRSPPIDIDGNNVKGPSPMVALLAACAGCSGADVVSILAKMRVPLAAASLEVRGTRRAEEPRRYVRIHFHFELRGDALPVDKAERAVALSVEKYCSVVHSLAPDIDVTWDVDVL